MITRRDLTSKGPLQKLYCTAQDLAPAPFHLCIQTNRLAYDPVGRVFANRRSLGRDIIALRFDQDETTWL
ncbi:hypothetical protein X753_31670 [Mesorhizobium sp. LNJC399B00]|nr:hypothetical protein X753_31670 [Mesorhizobium sp. LNJC399B00]